MVAQRQLQRPGNYLVRLQLWPGKPLKADAERLTATVWDWEVAVKGRIGPLSRATLLAGWLCKLEVSLPKRRRARLATMTARRRLVGPAVGSPRKAAGRWHEHCWRRLPI